MPIYFKEVEVTHVAIVCHEANRAYCATLGDHSQKPWEEAEQWQRDSAIRGVEFAVANSDAPASAQHDAWLKDKLADGWKYGPVKDPSKKEHPCIVEYEALPLEQRLKDSLFKAIVRGLRGGEFDALRFIESNKLCVVPPNQETSNWTVFADFDGEFGCDKQISDGATLKEALEEAAAVIEDVEEVK